MTYHARGQTGKPIFNYLKYHARCQTGKTVFNRHELSCARSNRKNRLQLSCIRLQNKLFFLSFFCRSAVVISLRDAGICDARIKRSHTRREENLFLASLSSPTRNFHVRSRFLMIRFHPKRHTLKYGLFCSLVMHEQVGLFRSE